MKRTIPAILGLLTFAATLCAQGFVEEFRSQPGRRPPGSRAWYSYGTAALRIVDLNGNGAPDMPFMLGQTLTVYDGQTREKIWELPESSISLNFETIEFTAFFKFYDKENKQYEATHIVILGIVLGESDMRGAIIDVETQATDWQMQNIEPMTIADLDDDNRPEILIEDLDNKQVVMVGWEDGGSGSIQKKTTPGRQVPIAAREDYVLNLKFESEQNLRLAYNAELVTGIDDLDINGDGVTEIVMLFEDDNGNPIGMAVRDGATREVKWRFEFPTTGPMRDDILSGFHGFFDVNGDGEREAIFGKRTAVTLNKTLHRVDENLEILAVHDIDDDGYADLVGHGLQDSTVQVWGAATTTGVSEEDLMLAGFQLKQNYPNPFNPSTTINYSVEKPGKVRLEIFDLLGRKVRSLVNEEKPKGEFSVVWDGKDDFGIQVANGHYFYRLKAGEFQSTRRMVLLK